MSSARGAALTVIMLSSVPFVCLQAQVAAPSALTSPMSAQQSPDTVGPRAEPFTAGERYLLSLVGASAGIVGSYVILFAHQPRDCNDFCGLDTDFAATWGRALLISGAVLGAALPRLGVQCEVRKRTVRAVLGAVPAIVVNAVWRSPTNMNVFWFTFAASTIGSTVQVHRCARPLFARS